MERDKKRTYWICLIYCFNINLSWDEDAQWQKSGFTSKWCSFHRQYPNMLSSVGSKMGPTCSVWCLADKRHLTDPWSKQWRPGRTRDLQFSSAILTCDAGSWTFFKHTVFRLVCRYPILCMRLGAKCWSGENLASFEADFFFSHIYCDTWKTWCHGFLAVHMSKFLPHNTFSNSWHFKEL